MPTRRSRRGSATYSALVMMGLIGFGALAMDLGKARMVRAQVQNAADAASHAGASELDGTLEGLTRARDTAVYVGSLNLADNRAVALDRNDANLPDGNIVLGIYDYDSGAFTPSLAFEDVNAVRVAGAQRDVEPIFSGAVFGTQSLSAAASSMGVTGERNGAGATACFLPFALPMCTFDGRTDEVLDMTDLKLQPATGDNIGWGSPFGNPTPTGVQAMLSGDCASGEIALGDPLYLGNGAEASSVNYVADAIDASSTSWEDHGETWGTQPPQMAGSSVANSSYGNTLEGPIILFDGGPEYCDSDPASGNWNASTPAVIAGFAWGAVYDAKATGSNTSRNIKLRVELLDNYEFGTEGGGPDHGVTYADPVRILP